MSISIQVSAIGGSETQTAVENVLRGALEALTGDWDVSVVGSQQNDVWELKIRGPNTQRRYKLYRTDGQHDPSYIRELLTENFSSPSAPSISLPPLVLNSWERLSNSAGNSTDVRKVLSFISDNWSKSSDEFLVQRKWGAISSNEESRRKQAVENESRAQVKEFEKLVWGVSQGPAALDFYASLSALATPLKHVAYVRGFKSASEENRVLILAALSQESQNFIQECAPQFPGDLLVESFRSFLQNPNSALKLKNNELEDLSALDRIEVLFGIASLRVSTQHRYIRELPAATKLALHSMAIRLIQTLPNEYFGRFVKLRLSIFACLSGPENNDVRSAKLILTSERDPVAVDVLRLTEGKIGTVSALSDLTIALGEQYPLFATALIDSIRADAPEGLGRILDKLEAWSKSKSGVLAIASKAALLHGQHASEKDFEKAFLRAARSKENSGVGEWLASNVDFLKFLSPTRLPRSVWKSLLRTALQDQSPLAERLFRAKLDVPDSDRYWQDGIELLTKIDTSTSERLLTDIIVEEIRRGSELANKQRLGTEPVRSFIQRRFWILAERVDSVNRIRLFEAIQKKMRSVEVVQLLRSHSGDNHTSTAFVSWINDKFVPYALQSGTLDADFGKSIPDSGFKEAVAERLATTALAEWEYLKTFPEMWKSARHDTKKQLSARVRIGLHAALLNTKNNPTLNSGVNRLSDSLEQWAQQETPALGSEFSIASSLEISSAVPERKEILEEYFRKQARHPHDLTLFLGANPWALKYLFSSSGNWPSKDVVFESICKSFVFLGKLRVRAQQNVQNIADSVLLDLGLAIRDILADIESDLAGYFVFRDVLERMGLKSVAPRLGTAVTKADLSADEYRIVREVGNEGLLRVFSHGLRAGDKVIDTPTVTQSGVEDDRD